MSTVCLDAGRDLCGFGYVLASSAVPLTYGRLDIDRRQLEQSPGYINCSYNCAKDNLMRRMLLALCLLLPVAGFLHAQHGTAPNGYFPMGFAGDTWTGEVSAVNDANREITLVYTGKKKTESFVGVLQEGYKAKLKDGTPAELKVTMLHPGTRLRVYYMAKDRKIDGRKQKFYEIFRVDFLPAESK